MTLGSLFTGIGGLDLGFGVAPLWCCERDPYARAVLAARHPDVPVYDDVTTLSHPPAVDVLTGGFPCQDLSLAGKGAGLGGTKSGLWFEMLRLIGELRPKVVVAENVAALQGRGLDVVVAGLEEHGYRVEATRIAASDLGAPHERMRLLILAWRSDVPMPWPVDTLGGTWSRVRPLSEHVPGPLSPEWCEALMGFPRGWTDPDATPEAFPGWPMGPGPEQHPWEPPRMVPPRTVPHRADRIRCLGNAVVPVVGSVAAARVRAVLGG